MSTPQPRAYGKNAVREYVIENFIAHPATPQAATVQLQNAFTARIAEMPIWAQAFLIEDKVTFQHGLQNGLDANSITLRHEKTPAEANYSFYGRLLE